MMTRVYSTTATLGQFIQFLTGMERLQVRYSYLAI